ncbi:hypothetical protein HHK36_024017 [Tetracentron sinense]|uniref:Uncharacterized protein n=1 Tax=Tetracentron sinense TaxID=13715 RepID=A0A835D5X9_TETSI|nr:hypothetical protein HHK36_024017 [Tetracentron sinense]
MAEGAIFFLLEKVVSFLEEETNLQSEMRADVDEIRRRLNTMEAFLKDAEGKEQSASLKNLVKQVQEVAYEIDDVLDKFMLCVPQQSHGHGLLDRLHTKAHIVRHWGTYHEISSQIKAKKDKIQNILTEASTHFNSLNTASSSTVRRDPRLAYPAIVDDEIVGITNAKEELIRLLTNGESRCTVISVVGTGGLGKTTLVKKVYDSQRVKNHFVSHAWINVSESFDTKELLKRLLQKLFEDRRETVLPQGLDTMEDSTLIGELKKFLQRARYVVVFDDVWSIDVWESMKHAIPNNYHGSRVMLITRDRDIASICVRSPGHMHNLQPLPSQEAWKLFCIKAFRSWDVGSCCPLDLRELSQEIVKNCEGLPLAVALIGDLLSRADKTQIEWKQLIHEGLRYELENNHSLTCITSALLLSYNNLPYHLKSCFLYFGVFPHDYPIKRTRLIRLWIAEGFVKKREGKTLEEVADDHLNKLMCASLIEVANKGFDGRARSYRVHHIMHKIILSKNKEENFSVVFSEQNTNGQEKIWRLSIQDNKQNIKPNTSFSYTRSLFMSWKTDLSGSSMDVLSSFDSLKVLDLQDAPITEFPDATLSQLRYLSLRNTKISQLPKSLGHSRNLETLDLKQTRVVELPTQILKLERLRHLLIYRYNNINKYVFLGCVQGLKVSTGIQHLSSLQKLSFIKATGGRSIIKELGKLTELRKLGVVELKREDGKYLCISIEKMKNLLTLDVTSKHMGEVLDLHDMDTPPRLLQRLYLKGHLEKFPRWISLLRDLVRIGLKWSKLKDNPLEALEALPSLIELKLADAYTGQELVFGAGGFQRLEILELDLFDQLNMVTVHDNTMPRLQKLTMSRCENLKIAPVEGDFSFSASLAKAFGSALNMVATSLDAKGVVMVKHPTARASLEELEKLGCVIVHEVDAHTMKEHPFLKTQMFDRIVFNFPHAGYHYRWEHEQCQIELHQEVLKGFFRNARNMLIDNGEVHVTHKTAYPFSKWEVKKLAEEEGLCLVAEVEFTKLDYPGYHNKRGDGRRSNRTFRVGNCSTFKFALLNTNHSA